ncbi:amidase [Bordetella holmesii]|uniref:Amidase n=2 Tax=Bordetella holmesii TaxID=35814 RepID=A0A158MA20_9BORD|nr:amidase [Bordetella holmesii]AHV91414.1 amidase family protein [Bordetella holmesii ATCC 51541]AIT26179.1 amidase family protein [Bordetella holmesii 44057]EWM43410.1 amidase family protein [Bordetella holmesii 41130]EWM46751.1 amidase family protein [Bordetella holmesii 35009]EWM50918.1 amidase family protein [Bordetella holmesii 70147]
MAKALNQLGALEAVRRLQRRELTAVQMARACMARIEQRESTVKAWAALDPAHVLAHAQALDSGSVQGILHGLPMGVKDVLDTHDLPTRYGSGIYSTHQPPADAAAVALCREAGALVLGKTVTTEFATDQPGPTRNPRNTAYTPGGSSSGSAAAIADDMVPLALGTQTAGSLIRPAAYCGIVGYKPTFGRVPRAGMKTLAENLDTIGGLARSVDDVALLASVIMGDTRLRDLQEFERPRVGMLRTFQWRQALPETRNAYEEAARLLSRAGAEVEEVVLPAQDCSLVQLHADVMAFEAAQALTYERTRCRAQLCSRLLAMLDAGAAIRADDHEERLLRARQSRSRALQWFERYDVILAPSTAGEAPFFDQGMGDPLFCRVWSLFGFPAVHLPFAVGPQGLPVGLQAVGAPHTDHRLLAAARWMHGILQSTD